MLALIRESNKDMTKLAGLDEHFDPMKGSSIVYSPMNREQLDAWFASHGDGVAALRTPKKLVSDRFVSMLYKVRCCTLLLRPLT